MKNELLVFEGKELEMSSVELVNVINDYRKFESETTGKKFTEKRHADLMVKLREELDLLESLGLGGERNISLTSYITEQNKEQPCYILNRDGIMQLAMSESAVVRYKVIEYINHLEEENKRLAMDNKDLFEIAISKDEQIEREYKAKLKLYSIRNIKSLLSNCSYKDIEDEVYAIVDFHETIKASDRYDNHKDKSSTEYKQHIRKFLNETLDEIYNISKNGDLRTISLRLSRDVMHDRLKTTNRSFAQLK